MTFSRGGWTNDPLEKYDTMSGDYLGQLQNDLSYRREVAELGIPVWESSYGDKFKLNHIEELKGNMEESDLLRFYGYTKIRDILGRPWSELPEKVDENQKLGGFQILNDMRDVVDNLTRPLYITDDGGGWVVQTRIKDSGDAVGWKRFDGDPDFLDGFGYITHDRVSGDFLYMTSPVGSQIDRFRMDGSGRASLTEPPDQSADPLGIAYDASGDFLYVAESDGSDVNQVAKVKMDGSSRAVYSPAYPINFLNIQGLDYDSATGFFYITEEGITIPDVGSDKIIKVRFDGTGRQTLGSRGSGVNQFRDPHGIHYDPASEFIYVADTQNDRIVKTKIDGSGWQTLGSTGSGINQFENPRGIYYDAATDLIYVTNDKGGDYKIIRTKIDGSEWVVYYGRAGEEFGSVHDVTM